MQLLQQASQPFCLVKLVIFKVKHEPYLQAQNPEDWREFLADPVKHWKTGFSAKSMAHSWEESDGVPEEISKIIQTAFGNLPEPLIIIPEFKVPLKDGDSVLAP